MADKLTREEILTLMRNGWSCWHSHPMGSFSDGYWALQKGKVGHGGETKRPHGQTMNAMIKRGLIVPLPYKLASFHTEYVLPKERS